MELMQLEMLVAVVEERSFLRAAERVFRTQPAVSMGLRKLEQRVGVALLDRSRRLSGRLTPAGETLYEYARQILGLRDRALSALKPGDHPAAECLRLGVVGEEVFSRVPALTQPFNELHGRVSLRISSDSLENVLGELSEGGLDVAVVSGRPRPVACDKDLVVTRVGRATGGGWLWIIERRRSSSSLAHAFKKCMLVSHGTARTTPRARRLDGGRGRVAVGGQR